MTIQPLVERPILELVERFNNTLRQRCTNLVRKNLSYIKDADWHEARIRFLIDQYNRQLERTGLLTSVLIGPPPSTENHPEMMN